MTKYEALRSQAAVLDLSDRGLLKMTGEDRKRLLHAMTTADINALEPGAGCYTYFLNAQGRILADANVFVFEDFILLDTEPALGQRLYDHLDKYIIADDVELTIETGRWGVLGVEGPQSGSVLSRLRMPEPTHDYSTAGHDSGFVAKVSFTGQAGFRIFVPAAGKQQVIGALQSADVSLADVEAAETVRLENAKPRYGEDISERYLAQETNQMHAVSFAKGCYLGQEIVERVRSRAQIHRILVPVRIRASRPPEPGTKLTVDGNNVGEITSARYSPSFGEVVALAYVRVEQVHSKPQISIAGAENAVAAYLP